MKVIFVCSGNTCRSPMAEGYLKSKNITGLTVLSRGFSADGCAVSPHSAGVMREYGIDITSHTSKYFSSDDTDADKIICMTDSHAQLLLSAGVPHQKVSVLAGGISDPFGCDINVYRDCRDQIFSAIDNLLFDGFFAPFIVRPITDGDIAAVAELERLCFSEPWSENAIRESIDFGTKFFVAEKDSDIGGYIGISIKCGEGYITNVAVFPQYRNMGLGLMLLNRVISLRNETELEFVSLEVRVSNDAAIRLYERCGFERIATRQNFYRHPTEDAIIMTRRF